MNLFLKNKILQEQQKTRIERQDDHISFFNQAESEKFKEKIFRNKEKSHGQLFLVGSLNNENRLKVETVKLFLVQKGNYQTFIAKNVQTGKKTSLNKYNFNMFSDTVLSKRNSQDEIHTFTQPNELFDMFKTKQKQELKKRSSMRLR